MPGMAAVVRIMSICADPGKAGFAPGGDAHPTNRVPPRAKRREEMLHYEYF